MPVRLDPLSALELLRHCPAYQPTPLVRESVAGMGNVWIKNESQRMGLGAFKALGGVYAVAQMIRAAWAQAKQQNLPADQLLDEEVKAFASELMFVCASAGNHGLAVATGAQLFGAKARIHLAQSVPLSFEKRLQACGARVVRSGPTYEDALKAASTDADETGAVLLADGSWDGYTEPPRLVMEGYSVLGEELRQAFEDMGNWPTHVFLQAGVGGLAAAVTHAIRASWSHQPQIIIVEPNAAICLAASEKAGRMVTVEGPESNMARLDCKAPSLLAFEILKASNVTYIAISDDEAEAAADQLSQVGFPTTPSGAAGFAGAMKMSLPSAAVPLVIVSEGA